MTEQTNTEGAGFVEDLGPLFEMWTELDGRECLSADLAEYGAEEMARQFRRAEDLLEGLELAAEQAVGFGAYIVLGRGEKARRQGERDSGRLRERGEACPR
jgi:hypothetical protein